jgi:predicted site-specific integrase-resolvase
MKQFLSATSFARLISKDPKTVISWIKNGHIPTARRIGKIFQIPHEEVEKAKTSDVYPPGVEWHE